MAPDDLELEEIQIFYVILPEYQGRGFASESAAGLVEYAFSKLGVERLFASMAAEKELNGVIYQGHRHSLTKSRFFEIRGKGRAVKLLGRGGLGRRPARRSARPIRPALTYRSARPKR